ncbi:phosphoribosyl-AMP cyclohydrolase [Trueperella bialowiezensis]|uniref:Phosphoribosyl-AMP cyclohydrolase n=1 Tax=Trueperella bialowiezensis TaxID=312285 RepID=A0A448PBV7_9ACTO|nr:phosphoribosyl-AMP cyclohydrolase [Trueperella bialowiezensis]VEI12384.1 phosphoribosyl-AMP cyclohydrolase [Trueperella bialowiezensis]
MTDELTSEVAAKVTFDANGLVPAIIQDAETKDVLMLGYMNSVALARTLSSGRVWFWSRSRQEYWRKGDTSGAIQLVHGVEVDCDGDALLVSVTQKIAACHTGKWRCFDEGGQLPLRLETTGHTIQRDKENT